MTLLDKALAASGGKRRRQLAPSTDEVELALAFFNGMVIGKQVCAALGTEKVSSLRAVYWGWQVLRDAAAHGLIRVERTPKETS